MSALDPARRPGEFVFVEGGEPAEATVREDEGLTVVLRRERADELGLPYDYADRADEAIGVLRGLRW